LCITKDRFVIDSDAKRLPYLPTNFIIDEVGLTGPGIIEYIKKTYPYARIFVLGDEL